MSSLPSMLMGLFFIVMIGLYFLPSIIAYKRRHRNFAALLALNILLGWTVLGWVCSLVWSLLKQNSSQQGVASA
ncbi:MAG: superinfection immunity protein [Gammaproteobacteria bacterium]|nr:superinfection immunity protein [Gammaproteobacteria bacterium]